MQMFNIAATASAWPECALGLNEMYIKLRVMGITMNSWEVLFDDTEECPCINCEKKWAKTQALRKTILQVSLVRYSPLNTETR